MFLGTRWKVRVIANDRLCYFLISQGNYYSMFLSERLFMSTVDLPCFLVFVCLKTVKIVEQEFNISPLNSAKSIHTYLGHFIHRMSVKLIIV